MKRALFFIVFLLIFFIQSSVFAQDVFSEYVLSQNEVLFNQSMFKIDVVDPVASTNFKGIKTESTGEEPERHIVIKPE